MALLCVGYPRNNDMTGKESCIRGGTNRLNLIVVSLNKREYCGASELVRTMRRTKRVLLQVKCVC